MLSKTILLLLMECLPCLYYKDHTLKSSLLWSTNCLYYLEMIFDFLYDLKPFPFCFPFNNSQTQLYSPAFLCPFVCWKAVEWINQNLVVTVRCLIVQTKLEIDNSIIRKYFKIWLQVKVDKYHIYQNVSTHGIKDISEKNICCCNILIFWNWYSIWCHYKGVWKIQSLRTD